MAAVVLGLAGCQTPAITNLTPDAWAENPSQIYTISARIKPRETAYIPGSLVPRIIINGQSFALQKSQLGQDIYEVEYQVPAGQNELKYYFLVSYKVESSGIVSPREDYSPVFSANIAGRYVLSLEVNRGPVGARISVLGRGFNANDTVYFDGAPVRTVFESANAVSFYVPAVEPGRNYKVTLGNDGTQTPVGTFRVDAVGGMADAGTGFGTSPVPESSAATSLTVNPSSLTLRPGERIQLTFTTPVTASAGGILIDVTTDVPESVIMPEVVVPPGSNTVTVTVEGGRPGTGSLFAKGPGARELTIPVTVR